MFIRAALVLSLCAQVCVAYAQDSRKPPKRAETPFSVFVTATPDDHVEQIEEARVELAKRLGKNKKWFRLVDSAEEAEIVVDLSAYWTRSERRYMSTWGVVPPTEGGQPDKTQIIEIITYHSIRGEVGFFGAKRIVEASKKRNERGRAKDAVKNFVSELERIVKQEYWALMARREAMLKSS